MFACTTQERNVWWNLIDQKFICFVNANNVCSFQPHRHKKWHPSHVSPFSFLRPNQASLIFKLQVDTSLSSSSLFAHRLAAPLLRHCVLGSFPSFVCPTHGSRKRRMVNPKKKRKRRMAMHYNDNDKLCPTCTQEWRKSNNHLSLPPHALRSTLARNLPMN